VRGGHSARHCGIQRRARRRCPARAHRPTREVIKEADDFFGKNVILASRITAQAQGGEILVSSLLKELTHRAGDIAFGTVREVTLKGIADPQRVCEVLWT